MSEIPKVFIHCKTNDTKQFPTAENFIRPKSLNDSSDYPFRINDGKGNGVFWLAPQTLTETGEETSPWIEYSKSKYKSWEEKVAARFSDGSTCNCTEYGEKALKNGHTENCIMNAYPEWHLCPRKTYVLKEDTKIYHIRTAEDYKQATMLYPGFQKFEYDEETVKYFYAEPCGKIYSHLLLILKKYFVDPMKEIEKVMLASGSTQKEIDRINPKATGPYIFYYVKEASYPDYKKVKKNISSFTLWNHYASINLNKIKKSQYTHRKAYAQLKYHISQLETLAKEYYDTIEGEIEGYGIDYNRLRDEGYQGVYLHAQAIAEGKVEADKLEEENAKMPLGTRDKINVYSDLSWWETESMFVWDWCFE
jgi:hypothetical protein